MTLFDLLTRDDLDITARAVVGLLRHRIAELVDRLLRLDHDIINRVGLQILIMSCIDRGLPPPRGQEPCEDCKRKMSLLHIRHFLLDRAYALPSHATPSGIAARLHKKRLPTQRKPPRLHGIGSPPHRSWIIRSRKTGSSPGSESSHSCAFPEIALQ